MDDHTFGAWSLLPPLIAIALSVATRRVIVSLAAGVFVGAFLLTGANPWTAGVFAWRELLWPSFRDPANLQVFAFTLLMGAMVGVVHRSGGMHGIVDKLAPLARSRRGGQLVTWLLGLVIFFDDYTNTLLLGTTMRPLADRLKISREKLAYLVDSTAAPVAGLAIVSTWVAVEISFIQTGLDDPGLDVPSADAFAIFVHTIPYRFYVLWALLFVPLVAWFGRDFGPMLAAESRVAKTESRAAKTGPPATTSTAAKSPKSDATIPRHWLYAVGPIAATVIVVIAYIAFSGMHAVQTDESIPFNLINVAGKGDSFTALVYGSVFGLLVAAAAAWFGGALPLGKLVGATLRGARWMVPALAILWLAWSLSLVCDEDYLGTGHYLGGVIERVVAPALLPTLVFLVASAVAFATGTSWGTMAILMPLVIPATYQMLSGEGAATDHPLFLASVGSVLAGAIFGDHCSPISDTTILSSQASGCPHLAHVWTQLPYALVVAAASILIGTLPVACGVNVWLLLPLGPLALAACLWFLGRRS